MEQLLDQLTRYTGGSRGELADADADAMLGSEVYRVFLVGIRDKRLDDRSLMLVFCCLDRSWLLNFDGFSASTFQRQVERLLIYMKSGFSSLP